MPLPTIPDPSLAAAAAALRSQLMALEDALRPKEAEATAAGGKIKARANALEVLIDLTVDVSLLATPPPGGLAAALSTAVNGALAAGRKQAGIDLAALAAGFALPGFPSTPPPWPDITGFQTGAFSFRCALLGRELEARQRLTSAFAADGKIQVTVNGLLELVAIAIGPTFLSSVDAPNVGALVRGAVNQALDGARRDLACAEPAAAAGFATRPIPFDLRPRALLLVENAATLRPSDELLRARLVRLGFAVDLRKAPASVTADGKGRALIVVSESVEPADVGSKFTNAEAPMLVCEPVSFRDLKMTGDVWQTDKGDITNQTQLDITRGHPLAAGLTGRVTVTSSPSKFIWGKPAAAARKVGAIVNKANAWGIFAYDTGEAMVGLNAPARRVGFFLGKDTPAALTDDGWRLFDAAVRWATAARALFTVGAQPLREGEMAVKERLEARHGLEVVVRIDSDTKTSNLRDMRVHIISESVDSGDIAARFLNSPAPTIVCEANLLDDMKLTGAVSGTDFGEVQGHTKLNVSAGHPLAAGLSGEVAVAVSGQKFAWGKPGAEAIKVAGIVGKPDAWGIFAYEGGANMVGTRASAPRIGFYSSAAALAAFTAQGVSLFDAAIRWARQPRALFVVGGLPLRPADQALRDRLEKNFGLLVEVKLATELVDKHVNGKRVVLVSESTTSTDIGSKLTSAAVALVVMEPGLFDDLKMTGTSGTDKGDADGQTALDIVNADHPLAAGFAAGSVPVVTAPSNFGWGLPTAGGVKVARLSGTSASWGIFGYESGAAMVGGFAAPARRVGFFPGRDTAAAFNDAGFGLFDAAMAWAASPLHAFDQCLEEIHGSFPVPPGSPPPAPAPGTWQVGVLYHVGDEVTFQGLSYRCRQQHTSQSDWTPPATFALWERINAGETWAVQVIYRTGDEVTHQGLRYRCIQGHQAVPGWEPPSVPALWLRI